jgi:hypothetical protein
MRKEKAREARMDGELEEERKLRHQAQETVHDLEVYACMCTGVST